MILQYNTTNDPAYQAGHAAEVRAFYSGEISDFYRDNPQLLINASYSDELSKYNERDKELWTEGFKAGLKGQ